MQAPNLVHEQAFTAKCDGPVCGIDEAGRGPWAGPVVAAAVILNPKSIPSGLNDSKKLTAGRRDALFDEIMNTAKVGIGVGTVARIDSDNILQATFWAMGDAVRDLPHAPAGALIDGNKAPPLSCPSQTLVKGDSLSLSIAAASIIAKVTRDRMMIALAAEFPAYGWERNKGYGTAEHIAALQGAGVTEHHRKSFAPIRALLNR